MNWRKTYEKLIEITDHKNLPLRIFFVVLISLPLFHFSDFYQHFYVYLTGNIITRIFTQQWHLVLVSVLIFLAFLIPLSFRRKVNWAEYGLVTAFFVSFFVEMYGFPLTILLASKYFFTPGINLPEHVIKFRIFNLGFGMDLAMSYGAFLIIIGTFLIMVGWITLYRKMKKEDFVMSGVYSFSRHPQYFGFILIITGWFIGWPTILTVIMAPILIYKYIALAKKEEKELLKKIPEYQEYKTRVPFFI